MGTKWTFGRKKHPSIKPLILVTSKYSRWNTQWRAAEEVSDLSSGGFVGRWPLVASLLQLLLHQSFCLGLSLCIWVQPKTARVEVPNIWDIWIFGDFGLSPLTTSCCTQVFFDPQFGPLSVYSSAFGSKPQKNKAIEVQNIWDIYNFRTVTLQLWK